MSQDYKITLRDSGGNVLHDIGTQNGQFIESLSVVREHTALSDFEARLRLSDYTTIESDISPTTEALIRVNGDLIFRGFAPRLEGDEESGQAILGGPDVFAKLRRENIVDYLADADPIATDDAIENFWTNKTGFSATVESQTTSVITPTLANGGAQYDVTGDGDGVVDARSEWQNNTLSPWPELPLEITNTGTAADDGVQIQQSSWTREGEDALISSGVTVSSSSSTTPLISASEYSDGKAERIDRDSSTAIGSNVEFGPITPEYTLPGRSTGFFGNFDVAVRSVSDSSPGELLVVVKEGSTSIDDQIGTDAIIRSDGNLSWDSVRDIGSNFGNISLDQGKDYYISITALDGAKFDIDAVQPHDERFNYDYDNDNGGSGGYLDGPELYLKSGIKVPLSRYQSTYPANITAADVDITWFVDSEFGAQVSLSNDRRNTYEVIPGDGTGINQSDTVTFGNSIGTSLAPRVTVTGQGSGGSSTPTEGYLAGGVERLKIDFQGNDLDIIEDTSFSGSLFDIAQALHNRVGYRFSADYSDSSLLVNSFPRGDPNPAGGGSPQKVTDLATVKNRERVLDADGYANAVTVAGRRSDGGTPSATVADQTAINNQGERIEWFVKDPNIETEQDAAAEARTILEKRLARNTLSATVEITPTDVRPGYAYTVAFPDGDRTLDLERVEYRERGGEADGRLEFQLLPALREKTTDNTGSIRRTENSL